MTLTRASLTRMASLASGYPQTDCHRVFHELTREIAHRLERGERVQVRGFASFGIKFNEARPGYDFHRKCKMVIPAYTKIVFRWGTLK